MEVRLNETLRPLFSLEGGDFDSEPTGVVRRNGATVTGAEVVVSAVTSHTYEMAYTPQAADGWAVGDEGAVLATALSGGATIERAASFRVREAAATNAQVSATQETVQEVAAAINALNEQGIEAVLPPVTQAKVDSIYANVQGGNIRVVERVNEAGTAIAYRGERMSIPLPTAGIGDLRDGRQVYFTVKSNPKDQPDSAARLMITRHEGLVVLNGQSITAADERQLGYFEFDDEAIGTGRIILDASKTAELIGGGKFDVQVIDPTLKAVQVAYGTFSFIPETDVTRAVT